MKESVLDGAFDLWWPKLQDDVQTVLRDSPTETGYGRRNDRDIMEEVLSLSRSMAENLASQRSRMIEDVWQRRLVDPTQWPRLLQSALMLLDAAEEEIRKHPLTEGLPVQLLHTRLGSLGYEHHPHLQVSVVDAHRRFVYHDWEHMIDRPATHLDILTNEDIYDRVFGHSNGVMAWSDISSNVSPDPSAKRPRFSIGIFRHIPERDLRLVAEVHQDIS